MNIRKIMSLRVAAVLVASLGIQSAWAGPCDNQPEMSAALQALFSARESVKHAAHDKGGWRGPALQSINNAIGQVNAGCAAADRGH